MQKLGLLLVSVIMIVACAELKTQPVPVALVKAVDPVTLMQVKQRAHKQRLRELLAHAQQALADDRLMMPFSDNAYNYYQQILALDEFNAEAHWGMQQITSRYLQLAEQAYQSGRIDKAEQMLQGAEKIAASPGKIEGLRQRYQHNPANNEFYLSMRPLSARSGVIQQQLFELAVRARDNDLRFLIVARSDAEGRWIYRQMSDAVMGYRLRGNIEIGRVPRVLLIQI